jgi:hypothetical protein
VSVCCISKNGGGTLDYFVLCVTDQGADNQHGSLLVDVLAAGDYIPFLSVGAVAGSDLDGGEVCAEISR